ncbi:CRISPR-associated ring nuclease Crn1 [Vulcanisaeta sp. JCM 14467]|uniref:CRISPR-associated ring nuclease Crn1 n=1 Tax=Vulcanisaeta sp. JCM 14467 TaxID=1295370 RepID=UPI002092CBBC|nr:CRISPR-associated ring nuclease Crn1 [Vulcanisaeta sp. JCM 14467]
MALPSVVRLVVTLGTTPGGVYESFINLRLGRCIGCVGPVGVDEVYVVRSASVEFTWKLVKAIFTCCDTGDVVIKDLVAPMEDMEDPEDFRRFMDAVLSVVRGGDYVDFTGGRKAMSVAAALAAREVGAHLVTTVVPPEEYGRVNELIRRLRGVEGLVEEAARGNCGIKDLVCGLVSGGARTIVLM